MCGARLRALAMDNQRPRKGRGPFGLLLRAQPHDSRRRAVDPKPKSKSALRSNGLSAFHSEGSTSPPREPGMRRPTTDHDASPEYEAGQPRGGQHHRDPRRHPAPSAYPSPRFFRTQQLSILVPTRSLSGGGDLFVCPEEARNPNAMQGMWPRIAGQSRTWPYSGMVFG